MRHGVLNALKKKDMTNVIVYTQQMEEWYYSIFSFSF